MNAQAEALLRQGVVVTAPESVEIGAEVVVSRIAPGVVIHAGCRIFGAETSVGPGCVLGEEAPVTLENCQLGEKVRLKGGYFSGAVFLDGAAMGSCAHVRSGTILEEGAELAHCAGLKQTLFFPFVVGGSLINFCDALMSGGTSRKRHSEIGSSFIHFNYTPRGDKATASLVGDVPRGVMLDQAPVFLGGQGGMAGPVRVAFGTVLAAGNVLRKDVLEEGLLVVPAAGHAGSTAFSKGYKSVARVVKNCAIYIGNIAALEGWYREVRRPLMERTAWGKACWEGALRQLAAVRKERLKRLEAVAEAVAAENRGELSAELATGHEAFVAGWPELKARLSTAGDRGGEAKERFLEGWNAREEMEYVERVKALPAETKAAGTAWLQGVVDAAAEGL